MKDDMHVDHFWHSVERKDFENIDYILNLETKSWSFIKFK